MIYNLLNDVSSLSRGNSIYLILRFYAAPEKSDHRKWQVSNNPRERSNCCFKVKETKGKTLEELENVMSEK